MGKMEDKNMNVMTDYERQFADAHHNLVYRFLYDKGLDISEYYDVVIFRYLTAVQQYLSNPKLQQYSFKTIAYHNMDSALNHHWEKEKRRREFCPITNTDYIYKVIGTDPGAIEKNSAAALLWAEVAAQLTEMELDIVTRKAYGATNQEIGDDYGLSGSTISGRMGKIRRRVQSLFNWDDLLERV